MSDLERDIKVGAATATTATQQTQAKPAVGKVSLVQAEMGSTRAKGPGAQGVPAKTAATPAVFGPSRRHAPTGSLSLGLDNEPAGEVLAGPTMNGAPLTQQPAAPAKPATPAAKPAVAKVPTVSGGTSGNTSTGRDPHAQVVDAFFGQSQTSAEALADSDIVDDFALAEANRGAAASGAPAKAPAVDADTVLDALASTSAVLHNMAFALEPWGYATKLTSAQHFVDDKQTLLQNADVTEFDRWARVIVAQRSVVGRAANGCQHMLAYLGSRGFSPTTIKNGHPAAALLAQYAEAAGTSALTQTATATLQYANATFAKLGLHAASYEATEARDEVAQVKAATKPNPRSAPTHLPMLSGDAEYLDEKTAGLQRLDKLGVAPTPAQLQLLELQTVAVRYRSQVANLQVALRSLNAALRDANSGVLAGVAEAFAGTNTALLCIELSNAEQELNSVDDQLVNALQDDSTFASVVPPGAQDWFAEKQLEAKQARITAAQTRFAAVITAHRLDGALFKRAEKHLTNVHLRTLVAHVAVMIAVAVATGGIGAIAGEAMGSAVLTAGAATTLEGAATVVTVARYAQVATSLGVDALAFSAVQTKLNGGSFGVNFLETLALNGTVMAALRPWQALARGWLGLDEEAFAIWLAQGQTSKVLATRGAVASVEIFTAMAINNIGQRVLAVAHGREPDEATLLQFTLDGAAMAMGHMINMQLEGQLARFKSAGAHAGELLGRMVRQRAAAKAVAATEAGGRTAAMDLVIEQRAILIEEVALWRGLAQDPTALKTTKLNADQASAKLASVDAQLGATTTMATARLTLQMNNITEEVIGGRLWAGSAHDINAALGHARKLGFSVEILDAHNAAPANSSRDDAASDVQAGARSR